MQPSQLLPALAAASTMGELRTTLDRYLLKKGQLERVYISLREGFFSAYSNDLAALADKIARLIQSEPFLITAPQAGANIRTLEEKFRLSLLGENILNSMVTDEVLALNIEVTSGFLKDYLDKCDPSKVTCVSVIFNEKTCYIPVEIARQLGVDYPEQSFISLITPKDFVEWRVNQRSLCVTFALQARLFSLPPIVTTGEEYHVEFPAGITSKMVINFINALLAPKRHPESDPQFYLDCVDSKIFFHPHLRQYLTLIDFFNNEAIRDALSPTINYILTQVARDYLTMDKVNDVMLLVEFIRGFSFNYDPQQLQRVRKKVEEVTTRGNGYSLSDIEKMPSATIPFDGLKINFTVNSIESSHRLSCVNTTSIVGDRQLQKYESLFCYRENKELFFLPKLAVDTTEVKRVVKTRTLAFLLSERVAQDPVWKKNAHYSVQECIAIAQLLEETAIPSLKMSVRLVEIAQNSGSQELFNLALRHLLLRLRPENSIDFLCEALPIVVDLNKLLKDPESSNYLCEVAQKLVSLPFQTNSIPERILIGSQPNVYEKMPPQLFFSYPREKVQNLCNQLNIHTLTLDVRDLDFNGFRALPGFKTVKKIIITNFCNVPIATQRVPTVEELQNIQILTLHGNARKALGYFDNLPKTATLRVIGEAEPE